jgi:hypothetical protein
MSSVVAVVISVGRSDIFASVRRCQHGTMPERRPPPPARPTRIASQSESGQRCGGLLCFYSAALYATVLRVHAMQHRVAHLQAVTRHTNNNNFSLNLGPPTGPGGHVASRFAARS